MASLPLISDIKSAVAKRYRVPVRVMDAPGVRGGARVRPYAWPRQVAMTLAVRLTNHSYTRIGDFFGGRDHTTVMYACRAVEKRRLKNPRLHQSLRRLTLELILPSQLPTFHQSEIMALASSSGRAD